MLITSGFTYSIFDFIFIFDSIDERAQKSLFIFTKTKSDDKITKKRTICR